MRRFALPLMAIALMSTLMACSGGNQAKNVDHAAKTSAESAPDNTAQNKVDQSGELPTPVDQGGSEQDMKITQTIRQAIMAADGLSMNARNVKVISQNGVVTLRGPVETAAEKEMIAMIARDAAGVSHVDDYLEVAGR